MRADRTRKAGKDIVHYTYAEQRDDTINKLGFDRWKRSGHEGFEDIAPPPCFAYLFGVFIDLYYTSFTVGASGVVYTITYKDIESYCNAAKDTLSIYEVGLIRKMSSWAASETNKAWKEIR